MNVLQWVLVVCGGLVTLATVWAKVIRPAAQLITVTHEMLPVVQQLTGTFKDAPGTFEVLNEIAQQFRTDSGSSLRDVVNRLEVAAIANAAAAGPLQTAVEVTRELATQDRARLERLLVQLDRLQVHVDASGATVLRIEAAAAEVADDLARAQDQADGAQGEAGSAADAASKSPD